MSKPSLYEQIVGIGADEIVPPVKVVRKTKSERRGFTLSTAHEDEGMEGYAGEVGGYADFPSFMSACIDMTERAYNYALTRGTEEFEQQGWVVQSTSIRVYEINCEIVFSLIEGDAMLRKRLELEEKKIQEAEEKKRLAEEKKASTTTEPVAEVLNVSINLKKIPKKLTRAQVMALPWAKRMDYGAKIDDYNDFKALAKKFGVTKLP